MFEKQERTGLIVKLYYNRDGKKLQSVGDVLYHSKKCRYVQLYVDSDKADQVMEDLKKERYVKKVLPCHLNDLIGLSALHIQLDITAFLRMVQDISDRL